MYLKKLELSGFKSFAKPTTLEFPVRVSAIVGPNGSGKSNITEAIKWVLGEQSIKSLRGKKGEDLIFNGSQTAPRLGKASVSLVFDNRQKALPIDYEEVYVTRKIFRDGENEYLINDSKVRLKDIVELLSKIGLGTSNHHIISQGEADRILNASPKERRQMIEDALGLKIFQMRKQEAERKLEKTRENLDHIESLKKEIQPHLKFLKKQVEKAEKTISLKEELKKVYSGYLSKESRYLHEEKGKLEQDKHLPESELKKIEKEFFEVPENSQSAKIKRELEEAKGLMREKEITSAELRAERNSLEREIGRLEGMIEMEEGRIKEYGEKEKTPVPMEKVQRFANILERQVLQGLASQSADSLRQSLADIRDTLKDFMFDLSSEESVKFSSGEIDILKKKYKGTVDLLESAVKKEKEAEMELAKLAGLAKDKEQELYETERSRYESESRAKELKASLDVFKNREENLKLQIEELEREKQEASALVGEIDYGAEEEPIFSWSQERNESKRQLERLKIRLEDAGLVGDEVIREYEEVRSRDEFFEKEIGDLKAAAGSVEELIGELDEKIKGDFNSGLEKINGEFQGFLSVLFGGGRGELKTVKIQKKREMEEEKEEGSGEQNAEKEEEGVDIVVHLPKKKISSIEMLSGGERALTSIALLFAMSQVNPPPFLVLDETDAALDEANSKKYSDMLASLSKKTQLIVVTHNRETMQCADILYGVTMGSDSVSKLLSIHLEQAQQFSK